MDWLWWAGIATSVIQVILAIAVIKAGRRLREQAHALHAVARAVHSAVCALAAAQGHEPPVGARMEISFSAAPRPDTSGDEFPPDAFDNEP